MSVNISVIIPVYNGEKFIAQAIASVFKQTFPVKEVIVINDGSKDGTEKILEQFKDRIIYKTIPNGGVSNARNVGIEMSRGDWIAFLDADDIWYPNKLENQFKVLSQHPSLGFCCCNFTIFNPVLQKVKDHFSGYPAHVRSKLDAPLKDSLGFLIEENFVGTASNVLIRREVLQKAGTFNTAYRQSEDYDLWLRCALHTDFIFMSEVLLDKGIHEANLTHNQIETCHCHERVLKNLYHNQYDQLKKRALLGVLGSALASKYYQIGSLYYDKGDFRAALKYYWSGFLSSLTLWNFIRFSWEIIKKFFRVISGGLISKERLRVVKLNYKS